MAKKKWQDIYTLINNATTAFGEDQINQIVVEAKQKAFNKAQLLKRNRKRARTAPQQHDADAHAILQGILASNADQQQQILKRTNRKILKQGQLLWIL